MISNPRNLARTVKAALVRDLKMVRGMRLHLRTSLEASKSSFLAALSNIWPSAAAIKPPYQFDFLPAPDEWWVSLLTPAMEENTSISVTYNLLDGQLLVQGEPVGRLPSEWTESAEL